MADPANSTFTTLNPGVNGDTMDETAATFVSPPTIRKRPRVVIGSNSNPELFADPIDTVPTGAEAGMPVRQVGPVESQPATTDSAARAAVAASITSVTLLLANTARIGATIYNDSTSSLYIGFSGAVTPSNFDVKLVSGAYLELPFGWVGVVTGVWDTAVGVARVAELT